MRKMTFFCCFILEKNFFLKFLRKISAQKRKKNCFFVIKEERVLISDITRLVFAKEHI